MPGRSQGTVLQVYRVWSLVFAVDLSALPYPLCPFPGPYRAGVPSQLVPVGSDCASRRGVVSRGSVHPRSEKRVGVRKWCLARPSSRRGRPEAGWRPKRALRSERRAEVGSGCRSSSARPSGQRLDHPSGLSSRYFGPAYELRVTRNIVYWAEPLLGSWSMRDPGFMNPTTVLLSGYKALGD